MATTTQQPEQLIRDLPLLARLPGDDMRALASRGRMRTFPAGTTIFGEGERGDSLHVVVEGRVRICVTSGSGDEATVAMVGPGDCFGELSLLDGRPRSASAVASTATKTFVVTRDGFVEWVQERPGAALAIMETLSLRLRRTDEALADLAFLDLAHRLAKQLISLASMHTSDGPPTLEPPIRINVTQSELASMLGVSRESVNKQLNLFAREKLLTLSRGAVTLQDPDALRRFA
ncbi:MAG: Crp/Fnr family transcriptional regulator [Dehalococcoidia bacterium]|nr:Crp/Fnr family transcriptional regulator [Dehalococcoidia bacterium]